MPDPFAIAQDSPVHNRAISLNNNGFSGPGGLPSTTSKSAS